MWLSETTKWGYRFPHTSYSGLDVAERVAERGAKAKPAEGDITRNEGKQKKSEPMLKEDAGTQNEDRIGTKTNEEVGKTRSEDKTDTKTKVGEVGKSRSEDKRYQHQNRR